MTTSDTEPGSLLADVNTARRPAVLIWELTQACDLACKHCRAEAEPTRHPSELTTAEGRALLDDIAGFDDNQLLVLSGGDPLYRDDAPELIEYGIDAGLEITLSPSGTSSLTPDLIRDLADMGLRRLALSIDGGSAASHDDFRQEPGTFVQTVNAAEAAQSAGLPLQINTTVCQATRDELPEILELVDDLGAVLWSVFFLVPVGRGAVLDPVSPETAEGIMEWLLGAARDRGIGVKTTEAPQYRRVALQVAPGADRTRHAASDRIGRRSGIGAGDGFAFISHTGELYPSGFLPRTVGNVRETSVVQLYREADQFRRLRDPDALTGKCGACEFRQVCGGSRSRAYAVTGKPLASDPLCPYVPEGYDGELPARQRPAD